jgi:phenylacetate-CoA ligase
MPRERLLELQVERLRSLVATVKERVPLYRDRLAGVEPGDLGSLDGLRELPFTRKDDLRDTYPFGLLATPLDEVARVHASSGTTGKPTVVAYTAEDIDLFSTVVARTLAMAGAEPGMMLHNAYGYGLFTGGLGLHYGGERLGLTVVPVSGGMTERQLTLIADLRPDVLACTPSYALTLAQSFRERGIGADELSLRFAVLGQSRGPSTCVRRSTPGSASGAPTSSGCRRSSARACRGSASRSARGLTSTRITSSPRSSTPTPVRRCPRESAACSC